MTLQEKITALHEAMCSLREYPSRAEEREIEELRAQMLEEDPLAESESARDGTITIGDSHSAYSHDRQTNCVLPSTLKPP